MDKKEYDHAYYLRNRTKRLKQQKSYLATKAGKVSKKRYNESDKGKLTHQKCQAEWKQGRILFLNKIKTQHGCMNPCCPVGITFEPCDMDFHHVRDKKFKISTLGRMVKLDELITELNKCVVLCAICHRRVHAGKLILDNLSPIQVKTLEGKDSLCSTGSKTFS